LLTKKDETSFECLYLRLLICWLIDEPPGIDPSSRPSLLHVILMFQNLLELC
jgi:hypothetical protein